MQSAIERFPPALVAAFAAGAAFAGPGVCATIRAVLQISEETLPAGGWARIKIYAANPTAIAGGRCIVPELCDFNISKGRLFDLQPHCIEVQPEAAPQGIHSDDSVAVTAVARRHPRQQAHFPQTNRFPENLNP